MKPFFSFFMLIICLSGIAHAQNREEKAFKLEARLGLGMGVLRAEGGGGTPSLEIYPGKVTNNLNISYTIVRNWRLANNLTLEAGLGLGLDWVAVRGSESYSYYKFLPLEEPELIYKSVSDANYVFTQLLLPLGLQSRIGSQQRNTLYLGALVGVNALNFGKTNVAKTSYGSLSSVSLGGGVIYTIFAEPEFSTFSLDSKGSGALLNFGAQVRFAHHFLNEKLPISGIGLQGIFFESPVVFGSDRLMNTMVQAVVFRKFN